MKTQSFQLKAQKRQVGSKDTGLNCENQLKGGGQGRMKTNKQMEQGASTPGRQCSLVSLALGKLMQGVRGVIKNMGPTWAKQPRLERDPPSL